MSALYVSLVSCFSVDGSRTQSCFYPSRHFPFWHEYCSLFPVPVNVSLGYFPFYYGNHLFGYFPFYYGNHTFIYFFTILCPVRVPRIHERTRGGPCPKSLLHWLSSFTTFCIAEQDCTSFWCWLGCVVAGVQEGDSTTLVLQIAYLFPCQCYYPWL